ncbi:hypothetical protein R1sor_015073 [Riccia sorocarpa]|uniref:Uncharacterized protein n=1 Tax=Riccia sorocarpa TaxID=122646 RepID=A0ABD3HF31_9MARC
MSKAAIEIWRDQIEKLIRWTEKYKKTDHKWCVKTWDEEDIVHGTPDAWNANPCKASIREGSVCIVRKQVRTCTVEEELGAQVTSTFVLGEA